MAASKTDTDTPAADLQDAAARLEAALDLLDTGTTNLLRQMQGAREAGEVDEDRARLAGELDASQARAETLKQAAEEAGIALDTAIAEVRSALGEL